jgi:LytS/YehU family sensor histidine kinase
MLAGAAAWFALHWGMTDLRPLATAEGPVRFVVHGLALHLWLLLAWCVGVLGVETVRRADARDRAGLAAQRLAVEARHRMLVYQVNPHFLFNTLNSVRALAAEDPERTRAMVTRLAEFLRAALESEPLAPAPLGRELDTAAAYLAIEQVRFEARLHVTIDDTAEARAAAVPGFLLHPLVENAITHGRGTPPGGPLIVAVRAWCDGGPLVVEVANGGTLARGHSPRSGGAHRGGLGVVNVRERLAIVYGDAASLTLVQDGPMVRARLTLPIAPASDVPVREARA